MTVSTLTAVTGPYSEKRPSSQFHKANISPLRRYPMLPIHFTYATHHCNGERSRRLRYSVFTTRCWWCMRHGMLATCARHTHSQLARPCSISVWFVGLSHCDQCDDVLHLSQLTSSDAAAEQSIINRCIHTVRKHYRQTTPDLLALFITYYFWTDFTRFSLRRIV